MLTEASDARLLSLYKTLWLIRLFEERVAALSAAGDVPGFVHLSSGQEAVAAGVCTSLNGDDVLFSGHRAHGHVLARGSDPREVMAEILGRQGGLCQGFGGSMHLVDAGRGFLGATGVVGGNIPLALGAAFAARQAGRDAIAVVFFGDGATGGGVFHESLNLASLWDLPVLFVCENNGYAEFTSREEHSRVALASAFCDPYGIPSRVVDGSDLVEVLGAAREMRQAMGEQAGPQFLECKTFRLSGHYVGDPQKYRTPEEMASFEQKDPIARLQKVLAEAGCTESDLQEQRQAAEAAVDEAVAFAKASPHPDGAALGSRVYGPGAGGPS